MGFSSWENERPNTDHYNSDDCVLMDASDHEYDWRDVDCLRGITKEYRVSFICQAGHSTETTTPEAITTTTSRGKQK